jgi:streptogramin lyase
MKRSFSTSFKSCAVVTDVDMWGASGLRIGSKNASTSISLCLVALTAVLGASNGSFALGLITEFPVPTTVTSLPHTPTLGPDGAVWFVEQNANKIGRISTDGVITEYPIPTISSSPCCIVAGPDGALWFAESNGNNIGRITTAV